MPEGGSGIIISEDFGPNLKRIRRKKGITQHQLAISLGLAPSTIGMYERSKREPRIRIIVALALLFDVTTDYLLGNLRDKEV